MFLISFLSIVVLILVIILLSRVNALTMRVGALQERVDRLEGRAPSSVEATPSAEQPRSLPNAPSVQAPQVPPVVRERKPSRTREEWEALIGGKVLNRIGALALIIAVGLFLKYAFDQQLISETVRVLIGALVGILALFGAYRTRRRGFEIFAQGLVGAGIAILYLSVYSSFNFYQLVPQWVAFVLMGLVTGVTLVHGVHYNSLAVCLLGWAGGFLTPIMLSTGQANEIGLFSYIAILDVGLLGILLVRTRWWVLEPLTFAATWLLYAAWYVEEYVSGDLLLTLFFVLLFWGLFFGLDVLRLSRESKPQEVGIALGVTNALVAVLALHALIDPDYHAWMGTVTLLFGAVYAMTFLAARFGRQIGKRQEMQFVLTSIGLAVVAAGIQFSDFGTVVVWSLLSVGVAWGSRRWEREYAFYASVVILGVAFIKFFGEQNALRVPEFEDLQLLFNMRSLALISLFGASLMEALFMASGRGKLAQTVRSVLYYGAAFSVLMLLTLELNDLFRRQLVGLSGDDWRHAAYAHAHTFAVMMALYTVPILWVGVRRRIHPFVVSGAVVLLLAELLGVARGFLYDPVELYTPLLNIRVIGLLILAVTGAWHARMLGSLQTEFRWTGGGQLTARLLVVAVLFTLLTGEVLDYYGQQIRLAAGDPQTQDQLGNMRQLAISGIWVLYSAALMAFGLWKKIRAIRVAAFVLFGVSILKIFVYDLSFLEMLYRIFSFIALGVVLLTVSYAYQKFRHIVFGVAPVSPGDKDGREPPRDKSAEKED